MEPVYAAIDLGAGSGRVMLGGLGPGELMLEELHRFQYPVSQVDGYLRWPFASIWSEVCRGLGLAGRRAQALGRPLRSVGACTWGVDYGLITGDGTLVEDPICYRDARTEQVMPAVFTRMPREEIFRRTGIQFLGFNTIFQLHAHVQVGLPVNAHRLLLMPDLLHHRLSGAAVTEQTNASTTQLVDVAEGGWDAGLLEAIGVPARLMPPIVPAGTDLGPVRPDLGLELAGTHVIAPATHDTGSAVVGAPLEEGWAYISSGTWSLVGVERRGPIVDAVASRENFTNEAGAFGTVRFLKNVMGLWLLESCRREWAQSGRSISPEELLAGIAGRRDRPGLVFPDDQRLFNPRSMLTALNAQLVETGQSPTEDPFTLAKIVLDSLAFRYARVLETITRLTGAGSAGVQIVGGGSRNEYLNQATANASGLPVRAGPAEATALGNVLVQAIAAGRFPDLSAARAHVRRHLDTRTFGPRPDPGLLTARAAYAALEEKLAVKA